MARHYIALDVLQMLDSVSEEEFEGYIDENYESSENEVETEVNSSENVSDIDYEHEQSVYNVSEVCSDKSNSDSLVIIESADSAHPQDDPTSSCSSGCSTSNSCHPQDGSTCSSSSSCSIFWILASYFNFW